MSIINDEIKKTAGTAHRVDNNIYIGGYIVAANPDFVRRLGITRIVKMFADDDSYPGGFHRHPGVKYLVIPADDTPSYDIRPGADAALRFIQEGIANGERILVHCHAGISRSSTVVLLHLMINRGLPLDLALERLRVVRPFVNPNVGFMQHLRATDARIKRLRSTPRESRTAQDSALMLRLSRSDYGNAGGKSERTASPSPPRASPPPARSSPRWNFIEPADSIPVTK